MANLTVPDIPEPQAGSEPQALATTTSHSPSHSSLQVETQSETPGNENETSALHGKERKRTRLVRGLKKVGKKLYKPARPVLIALAAVGGCILGAAAIPVVLAAEIVFSVLVIVGKILAPLVMVPYAVLKIFFG
ncbi:uncharacterized protein DSM5745_02029 [Aspergillus mulundensis]|uniref:Uncharacterized protein n=1 Tax=Aspergillus mulundensis TaxID=1810919 RepID=A0A3D8SVF3_9EURO|nr:hypothetical protein DSM5745_02029 [Aspergillus mulundensis]RDW90254.1 hypothetical protein DSM5745_02029 [Aspergillus mulundensis]